MEYMLLFSDRQDAPPADPERAAEMGKAADDLARRGKLWRAASLVPSTGARVRVRDGKTELTDGPVVENGKRGCRIDTPRVIRI